ncbi:Alpha-galactosidase [Talaromyces islandicus]|uniref:Alpha-galactosidase n=1 Tax=Talaromyces islandicus TaxID=28573 RepID=A0A0U1LU65_TALIS|nr:Alpha-galactosidase [Talaromyces islandicus]
MSDIEKVDTAASRQSAQSRRLDVSQSVTRVYSAPHIDNQSAFYVTDGNEGGEDGENLDRTAPSYTNQDDSSSQQDLENGNQVPELQKAQTAKSQRSERDPKLIAWKGNDDPENPKNWSMKKRWAAVFVVSCYTLISPVSSSMLAPALPSIAKDLNIHNEIELEMTLSIFVLAYAIGPLFFGPLSEIYGRAIVLQLANVIYLVFNIACGGSAPLSIGGGVMSDCFRAEERGKAMAIYSLAPLLGPAIGPIAGGFISENTTWRWIFYATSIADGFIQVVGLLLLQETYGPVLLQRKAKKLRKDTGDSEWHTEFDNPQRSITKTLSLSLRRPFILITTQPIVQALSVFMAYIYGLMYLMLASFPDLFTSPEYYGESVGIGGLNYISLGVGFFLGAQITARLNDRIYKKLSARNNGVGQPEYRTPLLFLGSFLIPVGLFIYGWTAQYKVHWIAPNIGAAIFCVGAIMSFQCIQVYLVDTYTRYAASALAAAVLLRSLAGFGFPLFAPYMFKALHYGWGNSLMAFVAIGIGCPAPLLLWKYGAKLRLQALSSVVGALDNGLAITPQLGWNTWNSFACSLNETVILNAAKRIVALGFKDLGYEYVVLDDCWSAGRNSSGYLVPDTAKFPNGIDGLAEKIHDMGLKIGIYSSAGTLTCARYAGSLGYEEKDAELWASWGIDYLKYDNCYNQGEEGTPKLSYDRYNAMGQALNKTGRPILYSMCNWGSDGPWNFASTIANSWRTSGDLLNTWDRVDANCPCADLDGLDCKMPGFRCSVLNVLNKAVYYVSKAFPGAWNDLDMLQVGNGGLQDDEAVAHMSLWAAFKSPLLMTNVMTSIDAPTLSILQNPAVLAISQDPAGSSVSRIWRNWAADGSEIQLFSGSLTGGDQVVVLLNGGSKTREMNATLEDIFWQSGVEGTASQVQQAWDVYDLWANRLDNATANAIINGTATTASSRFNATARGGAKHVYAQVPASSDKWLMGSKVSSVQPRGTVRANVPAHGVALLRLRAKQTNDEL